MHCPSCNSADLTVFHDVPDVPAASCQLLPSKEAARTYPRGRIRLGLCRDCGFISNVCFDSSVVDFSSSYNETQALSPKFKEYAHTQVNRLINSYGLRHVDVLEIGCGRGDFLGFLCELGHSRGIGIDPSYVQGDLDTPVKDRITIIPDFYSERHYGLPANLVCSRHTLEHIPQTQTFMRMVREAIGERRETLIFFEVPDVGRVLRDVAFWDIHYEHCSYFGTYSLIGLFERCGFEVLEHAIAYDDQYLLITARPSVRGQIRSSQHEADLTAICDDASRFEERYHAQVRGWRSEIGRRAAQGERLVLWGAGSKAISFLTAVGIQDEIEFVVDINPKRQGQFLAGPGQKVVASEFLKAYRPDCVIIMNAIYRDEIQSNLGEMGIQPSLIVL